MTDLFTESQAMFSDCRKYRYALSRRWGSGETCGWIMLNPSTADAVQDDPTIRKCISFSKAWGYGALEIRNIYAYRSTDPKAMMVAADPVAPEHDRYIKYLDEHCHKIVVAFGINAGYRGHQVIDMIRRQPYCLGVTKHGYPKHPLYLAGSTKLEIYRYADSLRSIGAK